MFYFLLSSMASRIRLSLLLQVYPGTSHDLYFLPLKAFGKFKCCISPPDWYYLYRLGLPKAMLCLRISSLDGHSICSVICCGSWASAENVFNLNEKKNKKARFENAANKRVPPSQAAGKPDFSCLHKKGI